MSVIIDHCAIPVVYGLLSNKNVGAYTQFFEAIRNAVAPDWIPNRMMSDFEAAALNAASAVFPNTFRSGCLFHLGQCIYRRIQRLSQLFARYNADAGFKSSLRSLQALAFVPLPYVYNYFCILASSLEPTNEMRELLLYFVNTWIGPQHIVENEELIVDENAGRAADGWIRGQIDAMNLQHANALFPMPIWNMCDRLAEGMGRTNNSVEGWHSIWNTYLKGNQRLASFVRKMISEDEMWAQRVEDFQASPADGIRGPHTSRRAKYVRQDNNLLALLNDFENRDPLLYMRACAYHLSF